MGIFSWLTSLFTRSALPAHRTGSDFIDAHRRQREPSPRDLLAELMHTAWACASINASVCASHPPRLYVSTSPGQAAPRCATRPLAPTTATSSIP